MTPVAQKTPAEALRNQCASTGLLVAPPSLSGYGPERRATPGGHLGREPLDRAQEAGEVRGSVRLREHVGPETERDSGRQARHQPGKFRLGWKEAGSRRRIHISRDHC